MEKESFIPREVHVQDDARSVGDDSQDIIPPGTFYADGDDELTRERIFAIRMVEQLGTELAQSRPDVVELYRDPSKRLIDIAYEVFPKDEVDRFPGVYSKAAGFAVRLLNLETDQRELTRLHRSRRIEMTFDFSSPEFLEQCRAASRRRHELHGVNAEAMVRGRGREPWSVGEKVLVQEVMGNPHFQREPGKPNWSAIAEQARSLKDLQAKQAGDFKELKQGILREVFQ